MDSTEQSPVVGQISPANRHRHVDGQLVEVMIAIMVAANTPGIAAENTVQTLNRVDDGSNCLTEETRESAVTVIKNGMTLKKLFAQLAEIKDQVQIPLVLMGYLNPIMHYGIEEFCKSCVESGVSGAIIPDLPFADYQNIVKPIADKYDLRIIMLITPETSEERIRFIDDNTDGFIYMVSSAAITGAQKSFDEQKQEYFRRINAMNLRNPRMIGFGISNAQTLKAALNNAAGAIIGSKFVTLLSEAEGDAEKALDNLMDALAK